MNIIRNLIGFFTSRGKALTFYRRGMVKAKQDDRSGAIREYTLAIEMLAAPADVQAMALFNRALVHAADNGPLLAVADLNRILGMDHSPESIKTEARRKLVRMERRADKSDV
ncbi:MAG TPA: hypothetical protein VFQ26_02265 [Nitrospiraceae bacterium]|nr:hypothetical protein [Nitrospiraceae bacterium]